MPPVKCRWINHVVGYMPNEKNEDEYYSDVETYDDDESASYWAFCSGHMGLWTWKREVSLDRPPLFEVNFPSAQHPNMREMMKMHWGSGWEYNVHYHATYDHERGIEHEDASWCPWAKPIPKRRYYDQ